MLQINRSKFITNMCYTWRHDYGLTRDENDCPFDFQGLSSGMTTREKEQLWHNMAQVFDHDIAPVFKQLNVELV